jgi:transposase InsO family protein
MNSMGGAFDAQSFLSKLPGLPWSKYSGEKHIPPDYNYCGPGTRLDIRLDSNNNPKPGEEPINRVDETCYQHDLAYENDDLSKKHEADRTMLEQLNRIENPSFKERMARILINGVIGTKLKLGVGVGVAENSKEQQQQQLSKELFKEYRRPPTYLKVKVFEKDEIWSADLVQMPKDVMGRNGTYRYILTVIDLYTRYGWAIPLQTKTGLETRGAFEMIFKESGRRPQKLWTDQGKEFYNKTLALLLKENGVELYSTHNEGKAVVVERFNRTLKQYMWKQFMIQGTQKWVKLLPTVLDYYNNKIHSSIGMTPREASKNPDSLKYTIATNNYKNEDNMSKRQLKPKFNVGDRVRIYRYKGHFEKGFTHKYTNEIFKVCKVLKTAPVTYEIVDLSGEPIVGKFYSSELVKSEF